MLMDEPLECAAQRSARAIPSQIYDKYLTTSNNFIRYCKVRMQLENTETTTDCVRLMVIHLTQFVTSSRKIYEILKFDLLIIVAY